jgi:hypothetical protein
MRLVVRDLAPSPLAGVCRGGEQAPAVSAAGMPLPFGGGTTGQVAGQPGFHPLSRCVVGRSPFGEPGQECEHRRTLFHVRGCCAYAASSMPR